MTGEICAATGDGVHCEHWWENDRCHFCGEGGPDEDVIESVDGDFYVHAEECQGGCDYCCAGAFVCGRCGQEWSGQPSVHDCAARRAELAP